MRWVEHVVRTGEIRNVYKILVGESERMILLRGPGVEGRIILNWTFKLIVCEYVDCIHTAQ